MAQFFLIGRQFHSKNFVGCCWLPLTTKRRDNALDKAVYLNISFYTTITSLSPADRYILLELFVYATMVNHIFQPDLTIIGRDILLSSIIKTVNRPKTWNDERKILFCFQ